jgi:hypothetical protein
MQQVLILSTFLLRSARSGRTRRSRGNASPDHAIPPVLHPSILRLRLGMDGWRHSLHRPRGCAARVTLPWLTDKTHSKAPPGDELPTALPLKSKWQSHYGAFPGRTWKRVVNFGIFVGFNAGGGNVSGGKGGSGDRGHKILHWMQQVLILSIFFFRSASFGRTRRSSQIERDPAKPQRPSSPFVLTAVPPD